MAQTWKWKKTGDLLHTSLAAGTLTLSLDGHTNLSFDGEGRLVGAWFSGHAYRRTLDNRILLKWSEPADTYERKRKFLSSEEARHIIDRAYANASDVYDGLIHDRLYPATSSQTADRNLLLWLETVIHWNFDSLELDAASFRQVYKPVSILPPDQYLSVVLQATEGCSYNACTFCTFYRDRPFRIKNTQEFKSHIQAVLNFLGKGLFLRNSIFLADANAIVIPQMKLLPLLQAINHKLSFGPMQRQARPAITRAPEQWQPSGINAFISAPDALRKNVTDLKELAALHVNRLYVGLESGHDALREFLQKPGTSADVLEAVETIKAGGLQVGLIIMAGVGGEAYRERHFQDTVSLIKKMPLKAGDIVYISPFVAALDSPYLDDMQRAGYSSLDESKIRAEETRFRAALLPILKHKGVLLSRYDIREFVY